jgi:hypothetical protein
MSSNVIVATARPPRLRWLAWGLWAVGVAEMIATIVIIAAAQGGPAGDVNAFVLAFLATVAANTTIGAAVAARRPQHYAGWTLLAMGLTIGVALLAGGYGLLGLSSSPALPGSVLALWFSSWAFVPAIAGMGTLFLLHFPNGHLPSPAWRWVVAVTIAAAAIYAIGTALMPGPLNDEPPTTANPFGVSPAWAPLMDFLSTAGNAGSVLGIVVAALSLVVRYRRATRTEQLQIKWIAWIGTGMAIAFTLASLQSGPISDASFLIGFWLLAALPVAIGIAILRYRLYEIERLVNRTVMYGALTALLAALYSASITLSQRVFVGLTGGKSDAAIVLTTLAVAWAYTPVRKRLETVVDRYLRYESGRFGAYRDELKRARDLLVPSAAWRRLLREVVEGLGAPGGRVERRASDGWEELDAVGETPRREQALEVPLGQAGSPAARLLIAPRPGAPYGPEEVGEVLALADSVGELVARPGLS